MPVSVTGLRELAAAIERLPADVTEALQDVARNTAFAILHRAQALVPVDTRYTRNNIHVIEDLKHKQFKVNPGYDRPHQRISLHTMKRSGRMHTQKVTLNMLPSWIERGTVHMPARPFMRPAADAEDARYKREMERVAVAVIERLGKF